MISNQRSNQQKGQTERPRSKYNHHTCQIENNNTANNKEQDHADNNADVILLFGSICLCFEYVVWERYDGFSSDDRKNNNTCKVIIITNTD